jgi:hypothetical protein
MRRGGAQPFAKHIRGGPMSRLSSWRYAALIGISQEKTNFDARLIASIDC